MNLLYRNILTILVVLVSIKVRGGDCAIGENGPGGGGGGGDSSVHIGQHHNNNRQQRTREAKISIESNNVHNHASLHQQETNDKSAKNAQLEDGQRAPFNATNWFCLDTYLATHDRAWNNHPEQTRPLNRLDCKCLMNIHCGKADGLSLWFRCFDFDEPAWLKPFVGILDSDRYVSDSLKNMNEQQQQCSSYGHLGPDFSPRVWLDMIRSPNHTLMFDLIDRLNAMSNISLTTLQLRNCSLTNIPERILLESRDLLTLNLTHNQLSGFDSSQLFPIDSKLVELDLSHNELRNVRLNTLTSLRFVDLSSNRFSTIDPAILPGGFWQHSNATILLDDNPWNCDDPKLEWLIQHYYSESDKLKGAEPECHEPLKARMLTFSLWKSIQTTKLCSECSCTLRDKYAKYGKRYVTVNCTGVGLTSMPTELPKNTKIVDVSNNRIRTLSNIVGVEGWNQITNLYVQNNSLETLEGFEELSSAALVDFSGNLITEIPKFIVAKMNSIDGKTMKLDKIRMGNNPYSCDCVSLGSHDWIKNNYVKIADLTEVRCGDLRPGLAKNESLILAIDEKFRNRPLVQLQKSQLCPTSQLSIGIYETVNIVMVCGIVTILVKLTYDYFWQKRTGQLPRFFKLNV